MKITKGSKEENYKIFKSLKSEAMCNTEGEKTIVMKNVLKNI